MQVHHRFHMLHSTQMLLRALQHPQADSAQVDALRNLVPWLEDRKIRAYKVEDRPALTATESSAWPGVYDTVSGAHHERARYVTLEQLPPPLLY